MNLCRGCDQDFASVESFDAHRVGKHAFDFSPERPDGRRCVTTVEMLDRGFRLDPRGRLTHRPRDNRSGRGGIRSRLALHSTAEGNQPPLRTESSGSEYHPAQVAIDSHARTRGARASRSTRPTVLARKTDPGRPAPRMDG